MSKHESLHKIVSEYQLNFHKTNVLWWTENKDSYRFQGNQYKLE